MAWGKSVLNPTTWDLDGFDDKAYNEDIWWIGEDTTLIKQRLSTVENQLGSIVANSGIVPSFETASKNLESWDNQLVYTQWVLTSQIYTKGSNTVTKTFNYIWWELVTITLSWDTVFWIDLIKTLWYTDWVLTSVGYSP